MAAAIVAAAVTAAPASAVGIREVAPDGRATGFSRGSMIGADTDEPSDVFHWNRGVFDIASVGPGSDPHGSSARFVSDDGTRVFFETRDPLLAADTDSSIDLYERANGVTSLVSTGPSDTGAAADARYGAASSDGTRVYFDTEARLVPADTDSLRDIYLRTADGTVALASPTPAGAWEGPHSVVATSRNGLRLLESTPESMTPGDNPGSDLYERFDGGIAMVSKSLAGPADWNDGRYGIRHITPDARSVVVLTRARMTPGDQNFDYDVYQFSRGRTTLVTSDSDGVSPACETVSLPPPIGGGRGVPCEPGIAGQTHDGSRVLFSSPKDLATKPVAPGLPVTTPASGLMEKVVATGQTRLVDEGGRGTSAIAADGSRYLLHTSTAHSPADTDDFDDLYLLENGQTTLLSGTGGRVGVHDIVATPDLRRVFFDSVENLAPEDTDYQYDTYVNTADGPRLAFVGPLDATDGFGGLVGSSESGDRWFFTTTRALVAEDSGSDWDLYIRHTDGRTRKLSP